MEELPAELLDPILERCDHASLKTLRLASRFFSHKCARRVFEDFHMAFFEDSLNKLAALAESPIKEHVKRFTFFTDFLPTWSREEWERSVDFCCSPDCTLTSSQHKIPHHGFEYIRLRRHVPTDVVNWRCRYWTTGRDLALHHTKHNFTDTEIELGWNGFEQLRNSQRNWRGDLQGVVFRQVFTKLPNLVQATATAYDPVTCRPKGMGDAQSYDLFGIKVEGGENLWMNQMAYSTEWWHADQTALPTYCLLEAIGFRASSPNTKPVTRLTLHTTHEQSLQNLMRELPLTQRQSRIQGIQHGFGALTEVCLHNRNPENAYVESSEGPSAELATFLTSATNLHSLTITRVEMFHHNFENREAFSIFGRLAAMEQQPLPNLQHLKLSLEIGYEVLLSFLRKLAPSLRFLELRNVEVGEAEHVLLEIPKILTLDRVYIQGLRGGYIINDFVLPMEHSFYILLQEGTDVDEPNVRAAKAYLLRQSEEVPDLAALVVQVGYA